MNYFKSVQITVLNFSIAGITDNTSILPTSLISPMDRNIDCNTFDINKMSTDTLMDVWASEME